MKHHGGQLSKSERLQRVYSLLKRRGRVGATTRQINIACESTRASSDVSDLRRNLTDKAIACRLERVTRAGRKIHRFTLVPK